MSVLATRLKELRQKRKDACDKSNVIVEKAAAEKRGLNTEERAQVETLHTEDMTLRTQTDDIERQLNTERSIIDGELRRRNGGRENTSADDDAVTEEFRTWKPEQHTRKRKSVMRKWVLGGDNARAGGMDERDYAYRDFCKREQLTADWSDLPEAERRAMSTVIGTGGGYSIEQEFQNNLQIALKAYGGMLETAETITTDTGALIPWPSVNDTTNTGEDLAENAQAGGTTNTATDPAFGVLNLSAYTRDSSIVLLPIALLEDSAFDIEAMLIPLLKIRLGRRLNNQYTVGTGAQGPTGIVTQVFAGSTVVTTASATAFTYGEMLKTEHAVDPAYRQKARWMFHDSTLLAIKLLVDSNGRPLFKAGGTAEGIQSKAPDMVDGYPITINQDMASLTAGVPAANQKTMLFGDFSNYKIRQVRGLQMVRFAERYMDRLQIGLMVYTRVDGKLMDAGTHPVSGLLQHA